MPLRGPGRVAGTNSNTMVALVVKNTRDEPADVTVVVEIPTGSRNKYEFDRKTGQIVLDRMLFTAVRYPADYGYIEGAQGADGDYLDALVLVGEPTFPGCRIRARPVGLFMMWDEKGRDEKIICVPLRDPMWSHVKELDDLQPTVRSEIEHFFTIYKDLEEEKVGTEGFAGREEAMAVIAEARKRLSGEGGD
jgi:inorganic pyrophosphatase